MLYFLINNKAILIHSMLAAGIVQDTFAGEAVEGEGGEEETTGGYFYCYFYWYFYRSGWKVFRFLALEFNSQNTHVHMHIRNRRMYIYNWRASEASETLSGLFNRESRIYIL